MKNITLSAKEAHIKKAREKARRQNSSLNQKFREWLSAYVDEGKTPNYGKVMEELEKYRTLSGKPMNRDERNER